MHVVLLRCSLDLVPFAERARGVKKSEAGGRVLRQCDVLRIAADVVSERTADLERNVVVSLHEKSVFNGKQRIRIYLRAVLLYGLAHRSRVRREEKQCEMNVTRSEFKLP